MSNSEPLFVQRVKKKYGNRQERVTNIFLPPYLSKGSEDNSYDKSALEASLKYIPKEDLFWYPDESLQINGFLNTGFFLESEYNSAITMASVEYPFEMGIVKRGKIATEHHDSSSIVPWAETFIRIWNWDSNPNNWGHQIRFTPCGLSHSSSPSSRNNVPVHILFKKVNANHREEFRDMIQSWLSSAPLVEGKPNSTPIILNGTVDFFPKVARFYIDCSLCSQFSINWLMMRLVMFSSVLNIQRVEFTQSTFYTVHKKGERIARPSIGTFEELWNFSDKEPVRLSIQNNPM